MFYIIISVLLLIATIGMAVTSFTTRNNKQEVVRNRLGQDVRTGSLPFPFAFSFGALVVFLLFTFFMSITTVDARSVGIQTSFGRYSGTLEPGFQLTAPWSDTEEFTTRLQTADLEGDQGVPVTFSGGGSGKVNATFRWSISDDQGDGGAKALWEKYRDFETVQTTLVLREGRDAVLNVANDYTPNDARTKQDVIGAAIRDRLTANLAKYGVVVDSVSVLSMPLDERTQASLDKIVAAQNDVERAKADNQRAKIDAETVQLREKAGALSAEANLRYCLDIVNAWDVAKNGALPATFNCGLGGGTPVIVGGAK